MASHSCWSSLDEFLDQLTWIEEIVFFRLVRVASVSIHEDKFLVASGPTDGNPSDDFNISSLIIDTNESGYGNEIAIVVLL